MQLWNNLSFDPQKTDVDGQIDLVSTLGNMLGQDEQGKIKKFIETMPITIQTHLIIEPDWNKVMKKAKNLEHIILKCEAPAIARSSLQGAGAVPSLYSHISQSQDQDTDNIPKPFLKVQKVDEERNQVKANKNHKSSLNHISLPLKKRNNTKRQIIIITIKIIEAIIEGTHHIGVNKVEAESPTEAVNKGEGISKIIIGDNTKETVDKTTPLMEAITIIIITVTIKVEVVMAEVVIITEVMAMDKAVIMAIAITNISNITHMMMAHRWSNIDPHAHFVVVLITLLNTVLRQSMT